MYGFEALYEYFEGGKLKEHTRLIEVDFCGMDEYSIADVWHSATEMAIKGCKDDERLASIKFLYC